MGPLGRLWVAGWRAGCFSRPNPRTCFDPVEEANAPAQIIEAGPDAPRGSLFELEVDAQNNYSNV
jgi:hypothetical protein